jgi:penicillin V acylase-like amidase (Ntn superfamily)
MAKEIDPKQTTRAAAYELWMGAPNPMVTFFKTVDVTPIVKISRKGNLKFNMLLDYCIGKAAVSIKEFYILPVGNKLMQYDTIAVNTIVNNKKGEVSSCDILFNDDLKEFNNDYLKYTGIVAVNEKGLGISGLNFVRNAVYNKKMQNKDNVAQFELIPWILGQCATVNEAKILLEKINIIDVSFCKEMPAAKLHWLIADTKGAVTVESVKDGIKIYDNPTGVLTNDPPFNMQMFQLNNYMCLSAKKPENNFSKELPLRAYSRGMGAIGLPGDLSSQSRFIRAVFVKMNSVSGDSESENVSQFFHILGSVDQQRGCCELEDGKYEITIYTSCCNADRGIYYYTTYENHQITAVDMYKEDLNESSLITYPLIQGEQIYRQN